MLNINRYYRVKSGLVSLMPRWAGAIVVPKEEAVEGGEADCTVIQMMVVDRCYNLTVGDVRWFFEDELEPADDYEPECESFDPETI